MTNSETNATDEHEEEGGLEGRRLQLIPHNVDAGLVFRFEFGPAILAQVLEKIGLTPEVPLVDFELSTAPYPGFYQLFRSGQSVYVGRTIRPIGQRLGEHMRKLRGRVPLEQMSARYLFVEDLSLVGLSEDAMIAYFHPLGLDSWGKMGFGSKATGFGRAGQESDWHASNPADLSLPVLVAARRPLSLRQFVQRIAGRAPVTLSIPTKQKAAFDVDHASIVVDAPVAERPFSEWIDILRAYLAPGWIIQQQAMAWYVVKSSL